MTEHNILEDMVKFHPLKMQKEAERMSVELDWKTKEKIFFLCVIPNKGVIDCVWVDPFFGMFAPRGKDNEGFLMLRQLPEGSMIINQHIEATK